MKYLFTAGLLIQLFTSCGNSKSTATIKDEAREMEMKNAIENKRWILQTLSGEKIPKQTKDIYIIFKNASAFEGQGGCNGFSGHYKIDAKTITLADIISTKMACPDLERETKFLSVLQQTDGYKIVQDDLSLFHGNEEIANFHAVYLK